MLKSLYILWEHNYDTNECSTLCISISKGARENVLVFIVSLNFHNYNNDINNTNSNPHAIHWRIQGGGSGGSTPALKNDVKGFNP